MQKVRILLCGIFMHSVVSQANAACPMGTYQWQDQWGTPICKRLDDGGTASIQGTTKNCPVGSYPWQDSWGNAICKTYDDKKEYQDTSQGCPIGTYQWQDQWGNSVCKRL